MEGRNVGLKILEAQEHEKQRDRKSIGTHCASRQSEKAMEKEGERDECTESCLTEYSQMEKHNEKERKKEPQASRENDGEKTGNHIRVGPGRREDKHRRGEGGAVAAKQQDVYTKCERTARMRVVSRTTR